MNIRKYPKIKTELECNTEQAFNGVFDPIKDRRVKLGHILSMSIPSLGLVLKPDFKLSNPENPEAKDSAVAVIECAEWQDGSRSNNDMSIAFMLSSQNKALFQEVLFGNPQEIDIAMEWMIYDYDYDVGRYFKRFYTCGKPVVFELSNEDSMYVAGEREHNLETICFYMRLPLNVKPGIAGQIVGCAFSAGGTQFIRELVPKEKSDSNVVSSNVFSEDVIPF